MPIGSFTSGGYFSGLDLPLVLVIAFFLFFLGLVYHLHQENKREGYPLVSERTKRTGGRVKVVGFPSLPKPKTFILPNGRGSVTVPRPEDNDIPADAIGAGNGRGDPVEPAGNPLLSGLGPAAWAGRADEPDLAMDGEPIFRPLRALDGYSVAEHDADPRGMVVQGLDKQAAGKVTDIWTDRTEHHARFLEVALDEGLGARSVLVPIEFVAINARAGVVSTSAITAAQFAQIPACKSDTSITAREENQIRAYLGGGYLWATEKRAEPVL